MLEDKVVASSWGKGLTREMRKRASNNHKAEYEGKRKVKKSKTPRPNGLFLKAREFILNKALSGWSTTVLAS